MRSPALAVPKTAVNGDLCGQARGAGEDQGDENQSPATDDGVHPAGEDGAENEDEKANRGEVGTRGDEVEETGHLRAG